MPPIPAEPLCQGGNRSEEGALEWAWSGHFLLATQCPFPLPPPPLLDPPSTGAGSLLCPHALTGPLGAQPLPRALAVGRGTTPFPAHLCQPFCTLGGGPPLLPWALFGLTVTFLPELPARPPLAEMALPPTPHTLSRHKDQRSDGFSLSPAALGGGGGSPEPWDGKSLTRPPPQQPRALHWMQRFPQHPTTPPQASLLVPLALSSPWRSLGSSFQLQPPSTLLPPSALSLPGASSQSGFREALETAGPC